MILRALSETKPSIAKDWDFEKNSLYPSEVNSGSLAQVWWKCKKGHEYKVSVYSRVRSNGCKVCQKAKHTEKTRLKRLSKGKSLAVAAPDVIKEWDAEKNKPHSPDTVSYGSNKKFWWKCSCGYEWMTSPKLRSRGRGCPQCSLKKQGESIRKSRLRKSGISFAKKYPKLLKEWDYEKNKLSPNEVSPYSNYKANWVCRYGHKWRTSIDNRTKNASNCPDCNPQSSKIEIYLLSELRWVFKSVKWRKKFDGVECDIFIEDFNIGIEVDGGYWHKKKIDADIKKNAFLESKGMTLIRVRDETLPPIEGSVVLFSRTEATQTITLRLVKVIENIVSHPKLLEYKKQGTQQNQSEYNELVSRLPAPPHGETLLDTFPAVASEWDDDANAPLTPSLFSCGSDQKVAWVCTKGHKWTATIKNRTLRKSGCPICNSLQHKGNCRKRLAKKLGTLDEANPPHLKLFDFQKNKISTKEISHVSTTKVWWKCEAGHSFKKSPAQMKKNCACPTCNTLAFKFPEIANQWDYKKNRDKVPTEYSWGSGVKVWWTCEKGHSWQTKLVERTSGKTNCPHCYNEKRSKIFRKAAVKKTVSLADANPDYLAEWDYQKNVGIQPSSVTVKSKLKVWWMCTKKHSYYQALDSKARGSICPECAKVKRAETVRLARLASTGSFADNNPELLKLWDYEKNLNQNPKNLTSGSKQKIWWRCPKGHSWRTTVNSMTDKRRNHKCSKCKSL